MPNVKENQRRWGRDAEFHSPTAQCLLSKKTDEEGVKTYLVMTPRRINALQYVAHASIQPLQFEKALSPLTREKEF